jgi:asparagine synthase (glutamine-hydrolysing)
MQYIDIHLWMVGDILLKADKMSMAHSLEVRVPFVDKEVFACASKIPASLRVSRAGTKLAFREAARRHLPEDVASKKKLGFPVPIRVWLKEEKYYQKIKAAFESDTAKKYFVTEELIKLLNRHKAGKRDNSRKIWTVYMFLVWHEQYFELIS